MEPLFTLWQFFEDGSPECVLRQVSAKEAVNKAFELTKRPAAIFGLAKRIIIVDNGDMTVFEWEDGYVIFPPKHLVEGAQDNGE